MITNIELPANLTLHGPYSAAVVVGDLLYTSGQIGWDCEKNVMNNETFEAEVRQVFINIAAILSAAGISFQKVFKVEIFVTDLARFAELNTIYQEYFTGEVLPVRQTVGVANLPKGASVEISVVAKIH